MHATAGGLERGIIMEYELPLNFKFEPDLSSNFSAIQMHLQGEYLGFKFKTDKDKKEFNQAISSLKLQLTLSKDKIDDIKVVA